MKKRMKSLLSLLLALAMLVGMVAVPVSAEEEQEFQLYLGDVNLDYLYVPDELQELMEKEPDNWKNVPLNTRDPLSEQLVNNYVASNNEDGELLIGWCLTDSEDMVSTPLGYDDILSSSDVMNYRIIQPIYEMPHVVVWTGEGDPEITMPDEDEFVFSMMAISELFENFAGLDLMLANFDQNPYNIPLYLGQPLNQQEAITGVLEKGETVTGWQIWGFNLLSMIDSVEKPINLGYEIPADALIEETFLREFHSNAEDDFMEYSSILLVPVYSDEPLYQIVDQPDAESPAVDVSVDGNATVEYQWYKQETIVIGDELNTEKVTVGGTEYDGMFPGITLDMIGEDSIEYEDAWNFPNGSMQFLLFPASEKSNETGEIFDGTENGEIAGGSADDLYDNFLALLNEPYLSKDDIITIDFFNNDDYCVIIGAIPLDIMNDIQDIDESFSDAISASILTSSQNEMKMPFDGYIQAMIVPLDRFVGETAVAADDDDTSENSELPEEDPVSMQITVKRATPIDGETGAKLSSGEDGAEYFCRVTFDPNGSTHTVIDSKSFIYDRSAISESESIKNNDLKEFKMDVRALLNRQYTIAASTSEGGTISRAGVTKARFNSAAEYTITPDEGMVIADVIVDGKSVGAVSKYTFKHIGADHTISAVFEAIETEEAE